MSSPRTRLVTAVPAAKGLSVSVSYVAAGRGKARWRRAALTALRSALAGQLLHRRLPARSSRLNQLGLVWLVCDQHVSYGPAESKVARYLNSGSLPLFVLVSRGAEQSTAISACLRRSAKVGSIAGSEMPNTCVPEEQGESQEGEESG